MLNKHDRPRGSRGCGYIRVSDDRQEVERQYQSLRRWAEARHITLIKIYEDRGGRRHEAGTAKRKAHSEMMRAVSSGKYDFCVIDAQDRLGFANPHEFMRMAAEFIDAEVELWSVQEGLLSGQDLTSFLLQAIGAVGSKTEMQTKCHRTLTRKVDMAKAGHWTGGMIPYGLAVVARTKTGRESWRVEEESAGRKCQIFPDGRRDWWIKNDFPKRREGEEFVLQPSSHQDRLEIVRNIYTWFVRGMSAASIARTLNEQGHRTRSGLFYTTFIDRLIKNPLYMGYPTWNKNSVGRYGELQAGAPVLRDVPHKRRIYKKRERADWVMSDQPLFPPIVSAEIWEQAQAILGDRSRRAPTKSNPYPLSGIVYCSRCNRRMSCWSTPKERTKLSLVCDTFRRYGKANETGCRLHRVSHARILALVERYGEEAGTSLASLCADDEGGLLRRLYDEQRECTKQVRLVRERMETWLYDTLSEIWDYEQLPNGRRRFVFDYPVEADEPPLILDLPGCESLVGVQEIYGLIASASEARQRELIAAAEARFEALYKKWDSLPSDLMRQRCTKEIQEVESELSRLRLGDSDLGAKLRTLMIELGKILKRITAARRDLAGQDSQRKWVAIRQLVDRITCSFEHEPRCPGSKQVVSRLVRVEIEPRAAIEGVVFELGGAGEENLRSSEAPSRF